MQKSFNKDIPEAVNIGTNIALSTKDPWLDDYDMKELHEDHSSTKKDVIRTKKRQSLVPYTTNSGFLNSIY